MMRRRGVDLVTDISIDDDSINIPFASKLIDCVSNVRNEVPFCIDICPICKMYEFGRSHLDKNKYTCFGSLIFTVISF